MTYASLITFVRSFNWKEWLALSIIVALHVLAGLEHGIIVTVFQLLLGLCVGMALIGGWRIVSKADKRDRAGRD